jgi:hypothetical protein
VIAMGPQLEPRLAALLESLCTMESAAREALFLKPEGEMMAVLDVLEPVEERSSSPARRGLGT